jgi:hypothetical protein
LAGMVKALARTYFHSKVTMTELARQGDESNSPCTIWKVRIVLMGVLSCVAL